MCRYAINLRQTCDPRVSRHVAAGLLPPSTSGCLCTSTTGCPNGTFRDLSRASRLYFSAWFVVSRFSLDPSDPRWGGDPCGGVASPPTPASQLTLGLVQYSNVMDLASVLPGSCAQA